MRHGSRAANLRRLLPVREVNSTSWLIVERRQFAINFANQRVNRRGRDARYKKFDRRNEKGVGRKCSLKWNGCVSERRVIQIVFLVKPMQAMSRAGIY
jgi:hypothetical protein